MEGEPTHQNQLRPWAPVSPPEGDAPDPVEGAYGTSSAAHPSLQDVRNAVPGQLPLFGRLDSGPGEGATSSAAAHHVVPSSAEVANTSEPAPSPDVTEDVQDRRRSVAGQQPTTWPASVSVRLPFTDGLVFHPSTLKTVRREVLHGRSPVECTDSTNPDVVSFFFGVEASSRPQAEETVRNLGVQLVERLCGLSYKAEVEPPSSEVPAASSSLASSSPLRIVRGPAQGRRRDATSRDEPRV